MPAELTSPAALAFDAQMRELETQRAAEAAARQPGGAKTTPPPPAAPAVPPVAPPAPTPKVETPAPTPPPATLIDPADFIDGFLNGTPPPPPAPEPGKDAPKAPESVGIKQLRERNDALKVELEQAREANKPMLDKIREYETRLAAYDIQHDPNFAKQYDAPLAASRQKLLNVAKSAGIEPAKAESLLSQPIIQAADAIKDLPLALQSRILDLHSDYSTAAQAKQDALANAPSLTQQLAEQRRAQAEQQAAEVSKLRASTFRSVILATTQAHPMLRPTADEAHQTALRNALLTAKAVVEGDPNQSPTEAAAAQMQLIYKGAMFDSVAEQLVAERARAEAILKQARARGLNIPDAANATPPKPGEAPANPGSMTFEEMEAARRRGDFAPGGKYDALGRR
jgi:hypothetical protein